MTMTYEETIFLIQFLTIIGIFLYKFYTVLANPKEQNIFIAIVSYVLAILVFGIGLITSMFNYTSILTSILFKFEVPLFILMTLFTLIELFRLLSLIASKDTRTAYNAQEYYKGK